MGEFRFFKSLTVLNLFSVLGIVGLIIMLVFQTLLAGPILGGAAGATGGGGGTYTNDWGSDTTNWKKGGVFVIAASDVTDNSANADIGSTNYRYGTFMKAGILTRSTSVGCKEVLIPYTSYAKNYSDGSYDKLKFESMDLIAAGNRGTISYWMGWVTGRWTDGSNDGRIVYGGNRPANGNNNYRSSRQNWNRHRYNVYLDSNRSLGNYGFPVLCKK